MFLTYKLGELGRPETGSDDSLLGDPVLVHLAQALLGTETFGRAQTSDEDSVRLEEIADCGSLSQELGVGEDVEAAVWP